MFPKQFYPSARADHFSLEKGARDQEEEEKSFLRDNDPPSPPRRNAFVPISFTLLILSNLTLAFLLFQRTPPSSTVVTPPHPHDVPSRFAGLLRNVPVQWHGNVAVSPTWWTELWERNSSYNAGVVALDYTFARAMDLPRAQAWPWDSSKGVYVLNGYHNLHCIRMVRDSLEELHDGVPLTAPYAHVQHCLLTLRDEILCNADDEPRYTGYQPDSSSAYGQYRMCRDWSKLEAWAREPERAGCWRPYAENEGLGQTSLLDRYRFCSAESEYKDMSMTMWKDTPIKRGASCAKGGN